MAEAFTLFGDRISGNCLKVAYVADYLKLPFAWREVDVVGGETRRPDFLKLNPAGQVPVVQWADGRTLAQDVREIVADTKEAARARTKAISIVQAVILLSPALAGALAIWKGWVVAAGDLLSWVRR